jgi:hypothetical protein
LWLSSRFSIYFARWKFAPPTEVGLWNASIEGDSNRAKLLGKFDCLLFDFFGIRLQHLRKGYSFWLGLKGVHLCYCFL